MKINLKTHFFALLALTLTSCSSQRLSKTQWPTEPVPVAENARLACKAWSHALPSHISHLSLSADSQRLYVSTSAEPGKTLAALRLYGANGKMRWFRKLPQPVKAQDVSSDGALIAVNNYDGKLRVFDASGNLQWEREHMGKPIVLSKAKRVLLFNDDDSESDMAFVSYDFKGQETGRVTVAKNESKQAEPLDMYSAIDESGVAVAMADQSVAFYDIDGKLLASGKLPGRTVSIVTQGLPKPRLFAISTEEGGDQTLTSLVATPQGNFEKKWERALERRHETIRLNGDTLVLYGNTQQGQALSGFHAATGERLWQRSYPTPATYPSLIFGTESYSTVLFDAGTAAGELELLAVGNTGSAVWRGSVEATSGVFSYAFAPQGPAIAVGAGEPGRGAVHYYKTCSGK